MFILNGLNGGPGRIRTYNQGIMSLDVTGCNSLETDDLQAGENLVTPLVTLENEMDVKKDLAAALRGLSKKELLAMLADVLGGDE